MTLYLVSSPGLYRKCLDSSVRRLCLAPICSLYANLVLPVGISSAVVVVLIFLAFRFNNMIAFVREEWLPARHRESEDEGADGEMDRVHDSDAIDNDRYRAPTDDLPRKKIDSYARLHGKFMWHKKVPVIRELWRYQRYRNGGQKLRDYPLHYYTGIISKWLHRRSETVVEDDIYYDRPSRRFVLSRRSARRRQALRRHSSSDLYLSGSYFAHRRYPSRRGSIDVPEKKRNAVLHYILGLWAVLIAWCTFWRPRGKETRRRSWKSSISYGSRASLEISWPEKEPEMLRYGILNRIMTLWEALRSCFPPWNKPTRRPPRSGSISSDYYSYDSSPVRSLPSTRRANRRGKKAYGVPSPRAVFYDSDGDVLRVIRADKAPRARRSRSTSSDDRHHIRRPVVERVPGSGRRPSLSDRRGWRRWFSNELMEERHSRSQSDDDVVEVVEESSRSIRRSSSGSSGAPVQTSDVEDSPPRRRRVSSDSGQRRRGTTAAATMEEVSNVGAGASRSSHFPVPAQLAHLSDMVQQGLVRRRERRREQAESTDVERGGGPGGILEPMADT